MLLLLLLLLLAADSQVRRQAPSLEEPERRAGASGRCRHDPAAAPCWGASPPAAAGDHGCTWPRAAPAATVP